MKKLLLAILLTIISTSAMAEWTLIDISDIAVFYHDTKSVKKDGSKTTIWELFDYKSPDKSQGFTSLSQKAKYVYDCKNESKKILYSISYEGNMGEGKVVKTFNWSNGDSIDTAIAPDTIGETLMKAACKLN